MSDDLSDLYWAGAREGRLVLQRCDACGTVRHYPRVMCANCHSTATTPVDGGASGLVHSWTVAHHPFGPDLPADLPYTMVTVDMPAGVRVMGLLDPAGDLRIGLPVRLRFEPRGQEGRPIPVFSIDLT